MKLSIKIFLGICIPAIISIIIMSGILVNRNFEINMENETYRCVQELEVIELSIEKEIDTLYYKEEQDIIKSYINYYNGRGIEFIYIENNNEVFKSNEDIKLKNQDMLNLEDNEILSTIYTKNGEYYLVLSTKLINSGVLLYYRNIKPIYEIKTKMINISIITIAIAIVSIGVIAYIISKTLVKPIDNMQKEMLKLSKGNFRINLKEGKDEFGKLAKNFNKMSKELEYRNNELLEMIDSKQLFIDNLSHEMNTPLTAILGYAELLEKTNCTEEQRINFLLNIENETKRIHNIYKRLLMLSYKEHDNLEMKDINIAEAIDKVKQVLKFKLEKHKIKLIIDNSINKIRGDETLVTMCISNLISNAIDASENGKKIIIKTFENSKNWYIDVIDEGRGISKENIEKIVEPFYRVDKARSRKRGGAGLGLSICNKIMKLHHGYMKIESELGVGSTFILVFPKI